jgi:hypothetical protein
MQEVEVEPVAMPMPMQQVLVLVLWWSMVAVGDLRCQHLVRHTQ